MGTTDEVVQALRKDISELRARVEALESQLDGAADEAALEAHLGGVRAGVAGPGAGGDRALCCHQSRLPLGQVQSQAERYRKSVQTATRDSCWTLWAGGDGERVWPCTLVYP